MADTPGSKVARDLFSPAVSDDPHPAYRRMREGCPVARAEIGGAPMVVVSRFDDVCWAFRNPEIFTSAGGNGNLGEQPLIPLEVDPLSTRSTAACSSPEFVPREIAKLEPEVRRIVSGLIDAVAFRVLRLPPGDRHTAALGDLSGADGVAGR